MRIVLAIIFVAVFAKADAQHHFLRDLWLNEASTPIKVNALCQDKAGYIWLATDAGLFYYNGHVFDTVPDKIGKPATAVSFVKDRIWVGYKNGTLAYVNPADNNVRLVPMSGTKPTSAITHIRSDAGRVMILGTERQGLVAVAGGVGFRLPTHPRQSASAVRMSVEISPERLLAATDEGLLDMVFESGRINTTKLSVGSGLPDSMVTVIKKVPGTEQYWVGTAKGPALYNARQRRIVQIKAAADWRWGKITDILPINGKKAWMVTEEGFLLRLRETPEGYDIRPNNYTGKKFYSLLIGPAGIIWCGTEHGLTMFTAEYMSYLPVDAPYKLADIGAMTCDKDNVIWFAINNRLYKLPIGNNISSPALALTMPEKITCLYADGENRIWIGIVAGGLWYKSPGGNILTRVSEIIDEPTDKAEMRNESILDITGTYDRLWVAGIKGVKEMTYPLPYTKKMFLLRHHNKRSGMGSDYVSQLYADRRGRVWMATEGGGVTMHVDGRYKRWSKSEGPGERMVYSITQDDHGDVWMSANQKGLYKYNGSKWQSFGPEKGLQDLNIYTLAANATGNVVAVHAKGLDVWYPGSNQFRSYGRRVSSDFIDSTSNGLKLYANDTAGNVYIPFERGFIIFRNLESNYDIRPVVNISSVSVFLKPVQKGTSQFNYDQNHISFRFDGVNFTGADKLQYRYKLQGYNDSWIVTNDESVTFPQLTTGTYTFKVQASLNKTFSRRGEATYTFTIDKPFWKRFWFIGLMSFFAIGISYGYVRFREENLRKVSSLQRERMMFEYEHLKSQVNPHFLFNSLNTLTNLIEEDSDVAMSYTSRLADLYRNMLSYRDKDLIYLYEEWAILENYMYIQQSRFGKALRLNTIVTDEVMYSKKIVPMALQLLVENAIKHNVVSQSMPLVITIEATEETLMVRNPLQPKISKEKGAGLGLINIRKRYGLLTKKQIMFGIKDKEYIVILPLI